MFYVLKVFIFFFIFKLCCVECLFDDRLLPIPYLAQKWPVCLLLSDDISCESFPGLEVRVKGRVEERVVRH